MTPFVLLNWVLCLTTFSFLCFLINTQRYLFLKPSLIIVLFFHIRIQWAATISAGMIATYLPDPLQFVILVHGFPLMGCWLSYVTFRKEFAILWDRITAPMPDDEKNSPVVLGILLALVGVIMLDYLASVSFSRTGLYAIFTDPLSATSARESSLKLLNDPVLQYGFSLMIYVFAPFLFLSLFYEARIDYHRRRRLRFLGIMGTLIALLIVVSLTGAKTPAAYLLICVFFGLYLKAGMPVKLKPILIATILALALPTLFLIYKEGRSFTPANFFTYLGGGIANRVFNIPMEMGLYHVHYAQTQGVLGIGAISKLAPLFNVKPVLAPNLIFHEYTEYQVESGQANASYVFAYYAYFGLLSLVFSLAGLLALDFLAKFFVKMRNDRLLLISLSVLLASGTTFIETEYTTALLSGGFLLIVILGRIFDKVSMTSRPHAIRASINSPSGKMP